MYRAKRICEGKQLCNSVIKKFTRDGYFGVFYSSRASFSSSFLGFGRTTSRRETILKDAIGFGLTVKAALCA